MQAVASPESPDWTHVQTLYLQGKSPKEIEAITGIPKQSVSVRASRLGWTASLRKSRQTVQVTAELAKDDKDDSPKLTAQSERTRTALADVLVRSAEKLASHPIHTTSTALRLNQDAESLVRNAKTVFGWSESQSTPSVRISVLSSFQVAPTQDQAKGPVIDVTPVKQVQDSESSASDSKTP